ncbi:hypothetical protein OLVG_00186 [Ostreococcus lucimarinus virus OlV6]|nr:hypothetical protein OLVG_00186 [Ostreococcus lucimarinus virus OlV6]
MALVTSPQTIPDLDYEYHTITVDTIGQDSANTFTCHFQQPLKMWFRRDSLRLTFIQPMRPNIAMSQLKNWIPFSMTELQMF